MCQSCIRLNEHDGISYGRIDLIAAKSRSVSAGRSAEPIARLSRASPPARRSRGSRSRTHGSSSPDPRSHPHQFCTLLRELFPYCFCLVNRQPCSEPATFARSLAQKPVLHCFCTGAALPLHCPALFFWVLWTCHQGKTSEKRCAVAANGSIQETVIRRANFPRGWSHFECSTLSARLLHAFCTPVHWAAHFLFLVVERRAKPGRVVREQGKRAWTDQDP